MTDIVVSLGGGTNSTALLIEACERGIFPREIIFADTGGEKPYTYKHLAALAAWTNARIGRDITIVRHRPKSGVQTLEEECLTRRCLPAIAYGFKTCSQKWKCRPIDKYLGMLQRAGKLSRPCEVWIGFDAGEPHRAERLTADNRFVKRAPLIEWDIDRDQCIEIIRKSGLEPPGKSACFFCPSSKKNEIDWLRIHEPDLYARALQIESAGMETARSVKGLGRNFSWRDIPSSACSVAECEGCVD